MSLSKEEISLLASFIRGVAGQEIVKYEGKFSPIYQFEWLDFGEIVKTTK